VRPALLVLCLLAGSARAEPWYRGEHGTNRILHLSITSALIIGYPFTSSLEEGVDACRWCGGPNVIDAAVRDALVWDMGANRDNAKTLSDAFGYVLAPAIPTGLVLLGTAEDATVAHLIDDMVPIFESMIVTHWVTRTIKIGAARTRPVAHYVDPAVDEAFVSFPSGHTSGAFAFAVSAGVIARARNCRSEPYVWGFGLTLAAATAYLRIAADKHYATDVLVGATIGVSAGLTVPLLMRRKLEVAPTSHGIAVAGAW
jgi:membrane-associated phospholipid phosphatase